MRGAQATPSRERQSSTGPTLSHQITTKLRRRIARGFWVPGQRLPSMETLAEHYGTSIFPVSQALHRLQREGLVVARQGAGTHVADNLADRRRVVRVMLKLSNVHEVLDEFRRAHPEYVVIADPYGHAGPELLRLLGSHSAPDLISFNTEEFAYIASRGGLGPVDEQDVHEDSGGALLQVPNAFHLGGRTLAFPVSVTPIVLLARRSVFEASNEPLPGDDWTGEDMLAIARRLSRDRNGDGIVDQFGYLITRRAFSWYFLFRALGGSIESWRAFTSPSSRSAARNLWEGVFRHHICPPQIGTVEGRYGEVVMSAVQTSRVAMLPANVESLLECRRRFGEDIALLRSPYMPNGRRASLVSCRGVGIPRKAVCREGALALAGFLRGPKAQEIICQPARHLPVRMALWDDMLDGSRDLGRALLEEINGGVPMHRTEDEPEMAASQTLLTGLVGGLVLPEEFEGALARGVGV